jgi:hypothetical protein
MYVYLMIVPVCIFIDEKGITSPYMWLSYVMIFVYSVRAILGLIFMNSTRIWKYLLIVDIPILVMDIIYFALIWTYASSQSTLTLPMYSMIGESIIWGVKGCAIKYLLFVIQLEAEGMARTKSIPITTYDEEPLECTICIELINKGQKAKILPLCRHCFHSSCIDQWLIAHSTCPVCR